MPVSFCKVKCVNQQDDLTDHKNVPVVALAFYIPVSCIYIIAVGIT